jgi:uncharacterized protein (DUF488 family)
MTLYTIGHGRRSEEDFLAAAAPWRIQIVADVRSFPRSRTNPQFNADVIERWLSAASIGYQHWKSLGGRRRGLGTASPNLGWDNPAFRGYADYMMDDVFWSSLDALLAQARDRVTAVMCSETLWWRCHRRMIADAASARGVPVLHIMKPDVVTEHRLSPSALIAGDRVTYAQPTAPPALS